MLNLKGKQMRNTLRRTDAQRMANQIMNLAKAKAEAKFGCTSVEDQNAFALGYLNSLLAQVASSSPAAMKELAGALDFAKECK
jgi:hypothetical protein